MVENGVRTQCAFQGCLKPSKARSSYDSDACRAKASHARKWTKRRRSKLVPRTGWFKNAAIYLQKRDTEASSVGECTLELHLKVHNIPFQREFEFAPGRKFRADFKVGNILIEVDGGTRQMGRHSRHKGIEADCQKINLATRLGFRLFRYTTEMVRRGDAIEDIYALWASGSDESCKT